MAEDAPREIHAQHERGLGTGSIGQPRTRRERADKGAGRRILRQEMRGGTSPAGQVDESVSKGLAGSKGAALAQVEDKDICLESPSLACLGVAGVSLGNTADPSPSLLSAKSFPTPWRIISKGPGASQKQGALNPKSRGLCPFDLEGESRPESQGTTG